MKIRARFVRRDPFGAALFKLENAAMEVLVCEFGAAIRSIKLPSPRGGPVEITQGFDDDSAWRDNVPYFGVTVGRFANRIARGRFSLDGREYRVEANDGDNHLHGGALGFSRQTWKGEPYEEEGEAGVEFRLESPDGQDGYPGTVRVCARIGLTERNEVRTVFGAVSDKPTPINLTNHAYFNLGGPEEASALGHDFRSAATGWLPVGPGSIPTGEVLPVAGTPFDFREPKPFARDFGAVEGGYDHCFVLDESNRPATGLREAAWAFHRPSGRGLRLFTDQPGFQLYTGNHLGGVAGRLGRVLAPCAAFCLESQRFPDSLGRDGWVPPILRPGESYRHEFRYAFEF